MSSGPSVARTVLTATLTVLAVVGAIVLVYLLRQPLTWLALACFVAVAVSGPVGRLSKVMPRGLAITLVYLGVLLIPALVALIVLPPLLHAANDLVDQAPRYADDVQRWVHENETLRELDDEFDLVAQLQKQADELPARVGDAASWLGDLGMGIVNGIFAGVTILILSIFLVAGGRRPVETALELTIPQHAGRIGATLDRMAKAVGSYIAGALVQATIAGTLAFVVMTVLGVPFAGPLAVLVGLFGLIPMVGATIAAVIVGIVTLFQDFPTATIAWVVWAIVYQQVENTLIQPRIQKRAVGVPALGVMVAMLFGSALLGVLGALVAVPVAASLQIGVRDWRAWRAEQVLPLLEPPDDAAAEPPDDDPPTDPAPAPA
ncbi:AI-2E family transporter [Patulibacter brassicae]|uniref:AI-2E family transporter n=1 Tax=Patulibacter brassicae TaxID=1705717 RepID=A0ABU4VN26_9ACTN|nr:AI-2E family transporter [Patulibacter brassicae]MDX8152835.1 AI-2E family transporter [Patulibacter brassicae]